MENCLVCAIEFETEVGDHRLTCSEKCRNEFANFRHELTGMTAEKREAFITKFLANIEAELRQDVTKQ